MVQAWGTGLNPAWAGLVLTKWSERRRASEVCRAGRFRRVRRGKSRVRQLQEPSERDAEAVKSEKSLNSLLRGDIRPRFAPGNRSLAQPTGSGAHEHHGDREGRTLIRQSSVCIVHPPSGRRSWFNLMPRNRQLRHATLLFHNAPAYIGTCVPFLGKRKWKTLVVAGTTRVRVEANYWRRIRSLNTSQWRPGPHPDDWR
jgi:hypothetical protein